MIQFDFSFRGTQPNEQASGMVTIDPSEAQQVDPAVSGDFTFYRGAISRSDFSITDTDGDGRLFGDTEIPFDSFIGIDNDSADGDVLIISADTAFFVPGIPFGGALPPFLPIGAVPPSSGLQQQRVVALFILPADTFSSEAIAEISKIGPAVEASAGVRAFNSLSEDPTGEVLTLTGNAIASGPGTPAPILPPGFEADDYLASHPDLIQAFGYNLEAATQHYLTSGQAEGRAIDTFSETDYLAAYSDLQAAFGNDLTAATQHYIQSGFAEGRDPLIAFDGAAYIASYDDLINAFGNNAAAGKEHYRLQGLQEGRTITFQADEYIASYGDLIQAFGYDLAAATVHYITHGVTEGRSRDRFDAAAYLNRYADLSAAFGNSLQAATQHYILFGFAEGRI